MAETRRPDDADAFMKQFKLLIVALIAIFVVPLIIYGIYLNRRLDSFENAMQYRPPEERQDAGSDEELEQLVAHPVQGQLIYVPAYSHVYHRDGDPYPLTITLSVRNTSIEHPILIKSVRYFDTDGKELKSYLSQPRRLGALATNEFLIERSDTSGGSGANFLVEWTASQSVSEPIVEAVMIDTSGQQGISFARTGTVIRELQPEEQVAEPGGGEG